MTATPPVPIFAIAGQPNEGKTTVLATLAEDDRAEIGPMPGTTARASYYPVKLDGEEVLVLVDTPGFQEPGAALEWFRTANRDQAAASAFLAEHRASGRFRAECEILEPLAQGAAVIYVVDTSRPVRESDRQEIEILRLCGNPRIAVTYRKHGSQDYRDDWQRLLARDFNLRREFDAHRARFGERMALLEAAKVVIQEWQPLMDRAIGALRADWDRRLREAAGELCRLLSDVMGLTERELVTEQEAAEPVGTRVVARLRARVQARELEFRRRLRGLFRHRRENWVLPELVVTDLFSEQVWRCFGLSRNQLLGAGAGVGAMVGGAVDVAVGGASLLMGAAVGAASGAVLTWMAADRAIQLRLPGWGWGPLRLGGARLAGVHAEARVEPRSNLPWILLDRAWIYLEAVAGWSHGRRDEPVQILPDALIKQGLSATLPAADRRRVARYAGLVHAGRGETERAAELQEALRNMLWARLRQAEATQ
jgi:hypothetical protein